MINKKKTSNMIRNNKIWLITKIGMSNQVLKEFKLEADIIE